MELTTEFNSITAPIVPAVNENSKITFSRTTSIDSNVSNAQSTDEPFAKQRNSARSTKSALSILLAAESEKMRGPPPTVTDSARTDMDIKVSTSGSNISSSIDTANPSDVPSDSSHVLDMYGNPLRRSRSGSQGVSHSKSHSRSNSISQSSMHSLSEVSDERGVRVSSTASVGRKSPFCELAASSVQESDQSLSVSQDHYNHHSNNHQDDHENHEDHHRHPSTGESARRILASTSYDSDFSDGGLGAEFAAADSIGSDAGSPAFSASDEEEEAGVQEFDEFADFNEFYHLGGDLNRSGSSGHSHLDRVFSGSADSWDSKRAPTTDKLTVKHLVITILNNELLFQPQSPGAKHKESLAAKFLKTSRDSIIGSFNGAKNTLLHAHLGINNDSNSTMSAASDASTLSMLQQNVLNAAYSLPRTMQKKVPKSPASAPQVSAQQKLQRDVDALLRTRLCLYPAEDDGTAMDDLPEFSGTNDILQSGIDDLALMDKVHRSTLLHLRIAGRLEDRSMLEEEEYQLGGDSSSAYYDQEHHHQHYDDSSYAVRSPTTQHSFPVLPSSVQDSQRGGDGWAGTDRQSFTEHDEEVFKKSRHRPIVGATMEVLTYDMHDIALNPVNGLGNEDRYRSSSEGEGERENSSSDNDFRDKFQRERSSSNNDIIQMFRTETDEMLQNKIEAALEEERLEKQLKAKNELAGSYNSYSDNSQTDALQPLKDREHKHRHSSSDRGGGGGGAQRKNSRDGQDGRRGSGGGGCGSDEKNTTYITISGRKNEDEEWRVVMKIPVRRGRPVVTLPTTPGSSPRVTKGKEKNKHVPNSRDIAICTPSKPTDSDKKKPPTPLAMPVGKRLHFNSFDLDSLTSAAVQANLDPADHLRERKSETELNFRPDNDMSADLYYGTVVSNPKPKPGHQRNRTFDFAQLSGKFSGKENTTTPPLPGGGEGKENHEEEEEDAGFVRRHSNNSQWTSRSKSTDLEQGAYLLNPHTSSSAINYFAISASNTPTNTTRKTLSASANHSNNSSGSNLRAVLLAASASGKGAIADLNSSSLSPKGRPPEDYGGEFNAFPPYSQHHHRLQDHSGSNSVYDAHDTIQVARHSRSNSILSQQLQLEAQDPTGGTATNRSSISSDLSDGSCFSQLHQQLLAAQQQQQQQQQPASRNSSRPGSMNLIYSANLAGGGFSSDDCSDGGSSSSSSSSVGSNADADAAEGAGAGEPGSHSHWHSGRSSQADSIGKHGHPHHSHHKHHHKSTRKNGAGRNLPSINVSLDPVDRFNSSHHSSHPSSHHSSRHSSQNSSGNRSPAAEKETSPTNRNKPAASSNNNTPGSYPVQIPQSPNSPIPTASTDKAAATATEGVSTTGQGEKSSFYFLSRLFGTFRRSTATTIVPRTSAVNIGIIHEAEFEDSDSSGSNHSSVKEEDSEDNKQE